MAGLSVEKKQESKPRKIYIKGEIYSQNKNIHFREHIYSKEPHLDFLMESLGSVFCLRVCSFANGIISHPKNVDR